MKPYLLDTNLLIYSIRNDYRWEMACQAFNIGDNNNFISVVSVGELWSLAMRNEWGQKKLDALEQIGESFIIADINVREIIRRYAEIDAYSQGKLKDKPLGTSSRNMGKNDLWIAATASVLNLSLLTTDLDFEHLNRVYLKIERI